jgi:hypothetical protein
MLSYTDNAGEGGVDHVKNDATARHRAKLEVTCLPAAWTGQLVVKAIKSNLKLFTDASGTTEETLPWTIDFAGAPVERFVEGTAASDPKLDTGLTLDVKDLSDVVDTVKMTVVETKLGVCLDAVGTGLPTPLSETEKKDPGRLLLKQDTGFGRKRAKLTLAKKPKDAPCELTLKAANAKVSLFPEANELHGSGETAETLPKTIAAGDITDEAKGLIFWAEGADLTTLRESTFEIDIPDVEDACDKVYLTVVDLRAEDGVKAPPRLVPVKNKITEPAGTHVTKVKIVHSLGTPTFAWSSTSTKLALTDQTTDTVTLTADVNPSARPEDEELKLILTPSTGAAFPAISHMLGVVKIEFEEEATHPGGYDKYETLNHIDQNGTTSTVDPTDKYDFISIEKSTDGKVTVKYEGAKKEDIFFKSEDEGIAKPKVDNPAGTSPYVLEIEGKNKDKDKTLLNARLESATGPIVATLGTVVLKKATYEAELFRVEDSASGRTALTTAVTGTQATLHNQKCYQGGIATLTVSGGTAVTDIAYDTGPGCVTNGCLDLEPGIPSTEEAAIMAGCISTKSRIIIVHELRWSYFLDTDAAINDTTITIKNYGTACLGYISVGTQYDVVDSAGSESIQPSAVDTGTGVITLQNGLTRAFSVANGAALIFPLGGLSGDPAWAQEELGVAPVLKDVIGHELGHQLAGFDDICETANLMYGVAEVRANLHLRHRGLPKYYGGGDEEQWYTMNR